MEKRREVFDILLDIKRQIPNFEREELLEYTKLAIPILYNEIKEDVVETKVKCDKDLIKKLIEQKEQYRITEKMDRINIQYVELYDCIKENNETLIKVYVSVCFYDNAKNNGDGKEDRKLYWNDIWIVTYKDTQLTKKFDGNCKNCGAVMEYNNLSKTFTCEYCRNVVNTNNWVRDWEFVNIEIDK